MKKDIIKLIALLFLGAGALSGCAIDNGRYHRGHYNDRYHDRDHDGYRDRDRYHDNNYGHNGGYRNNY